MKQPKVYYFAPFVFFFLLLLDGQLTRLLDTWTKNIHIANAHFLLLAFLVAAAYLPKGYLLITAFIMGLIYDMYYVGVVGVYALIIPVIVLLMYTFQNTIQQNLFTLFFSMIIFVTLFETASLLIQMVFKLAEVDSMYFITRFLGPTLLLNMIIFVIFIFPFKKLFAIE